MPMRCLFLPLALLLLAGCDTLSTTGSGGADLMSRLDGTWTRTITMERIRSDGSVTPEGTPEVDAFEVGRVIECNRTTLQNAGEDDRIAVSYDPAAPRGFRDCSVITSDGTASRLIFIGAGGNIIDDVVATIVEDSTSRQVWSFYRFDGAEAVRTLWTLTR